jgi:hypothetical protein
MPRKYFRRYLPTHEQVTRNRYIAWFGRFPKTLSSPITEFFSQGLATGGD